MDINLVPRVAGTRRFRPRRGWSSAYALPAGVYFRFPIAAFVAVRPLARAMRG